MFVIAGNSHTLIMTASFKTIRFQGDKVNTGSPAYLSEALKGPEITSNYDTNAIKNTLLAKKTHF